MNENVNENDEDILKYSSMSLLDEGIGSVEVSEKVMLNDNFLTKIRSGFIEYVFCVSLTSVCRGSFKFRVNKLKEKYLNGFGVLIVMMMFPIIYGAILQNTSFGNNSHFIAYGLALTMLVFYVITSKIIDSEIKFKQKMHKQNYLKRLILDKQQSNY